MLPDVAPEIRPQVRIVVHPTTKGWTWTQVSRNGSASAMAPSPFDNKANAKRAGQRQVALLNHRRVDALFGPELAKPLDYAKLEVRDTDPGYV